MIHNNNSFETRKPKILKRKKKLYKILKMCNYKYQMGYKETAQPIRDENCPQLPSKPIRVEADYTDCTVIIIYGGMSCGTVIPLWTRKISRIFIICRSQMYIGYNQRSILYWHCNKFNILWVVLTMYGLTERIINE
jgi:hypothetical protein